MFRCLSQNLRLLAQEAQLPWLMGSKFALDSRIMYKEKSNIRSNLSSLELDCFMELIRWKILLIITVPKKLTISYRQKLD